MSNKKNSNDNIIDNNKSVYHHYEVLETVVAGISLEGNEVKSLRLNSASLKGSFCKFFNNDLFLMDLNIKILTTTNSWKNTEADRARQLLMTRKELKKWQVKVNQDGLTIMPIKLFFNERNYCKIVVGLCKGKKLHDKRESLKKKDLNRQAERDLKNY